MLRGPRTVSLAALLWITVAPASSLLAQADPGATVVTAHETFPNPVFGSSLRVASGCTAAAPCSWFSASTWTQAAVPGANTRVIVDGGVTVDGVGAIALEIGVYPDGLLRFATGETTSLATGSLVVFEGGALEIGTQQEPVDAAASAELVFRDLAFEAGDPQQHLRGLVVIEGKLRIHGAPVPSPFLRLTAAPAVGATQLFVESSAHAAGWSVGDALVLPNSRQCPVHSGPCPDRTEDRTISSISPDGLTVGVAPSLTFAHPGAKGDDGTVDFFPHAVHTTRNVVLRSEDPSGIRGHVLLHGRADVNVRYAAFESLGRTNIDDLGPNNRKGRYPVHAHHLIGPQSPPASEHQYVLLGNVVDFGPENSSQDRKWGITIHGSHYGLVERNVVDHASGAGVATEDASETGNVFRRNFVVRVVGGNGARTEDRDPGDNTKLGRAGVAYWFNGGGGNVFEDNVAAAVAECTYCYGFKFDNVYNGNVEIPQFQGADPHDGGGVEVDSYAIPISHFHRNEAYSVPNGLTIWWVCTLFETPREGCWSEVRDFRVWHAHRWGYFGYETSGMVLEGFVLRGDAAVLTNNFESLIAFNLVDYMQRLTVIRHADVQGAALGIEGPVHRDRRDVTGPLNGFTLVEDSLISAGTGIDLPMPSSTNGADNLSPQTMLLRNVRFAHPSTRQGSFISYTASGAGGATSENPDLRNDVWILDFNQPPGVDGPDLYMIPEYQGPSVCDADLANCAQEVTSSYPKLDDAHVYPLAAPPPLVPPFDSLLFEDDFESGDASVWSGQ